MTLRTIALTAHVDVDGVLRLEILGNAANTDVDVVIVVDAQLPSATALHTPPSHADESLAELSERAEAFGWPPGCIADTYGVQRDDPIERLPQGHFEDRKVLE